MFWAISDSMLAAALLALAIVFLAGAFLLILRTSPFQFSLRFLLFTIASIAAALGLWTAVLRSANLPLPIQTETDRPSEMKPAPEQPPAKPAGPDRPPHP